MRKLKDERGFSLVESLCAVIMLLLVSAVIMTGTRFAADTFTRSVSLSEAEVLGSTLKTVISEELRTTENIELKNGRVTGIFSKNYGSGEDGEMSAFGALNELDEPAAVGQITLGGERLLSSTAYTYGAKASVSVTYSAAAECYTATLTVYDRRGKEVKTMEFDVMPLSPPVVNRA